MRKFIRGTSLLMQKPSRINKVLEDDEVNREAFTRKYNLPDGLKEIDFSFFCKSDTVSVHPFAFLDGGSLPTDIALLRMLAARFENCAYFEIGTWRGESVANVAAVAKECYTLNLSAAELRAMGRDEKYISLHRFYSKNISNVTHLEGNSTAFDFSPYRKKFDLVFIDGDHKYEAVKKDTQSCIELLRDEKSIIVWHDAKHSPEEPRWEVLRGILDGMPVEMHKHLFFVSNTLCAVCFPFEVHAETKHFPGTPVNDFTITLEIKKHA